MHIRSSRRANMTSVVLYLYLHTHFRCSASLDVVSVCNYMRYLELVNSLRIGSFVRFVYTSSRVRG